jgi:hypothetical protein
MENKINKIMKKIDESNLALIGPIDSIDSRWGWDDDAMNGSLNIAIKDIIGKEEFEKLSSKELDEIDAIILSRERIPFDWWGLFK